MSRVIIIGGGLAGLSAAHTVIENGGKVTLVDKMAFLGGNSTKATSGISGTLTKAQVNQNVHDCKSPLPSSQLPSADPPAPWRTC